MKAEIKRSTILLIMLSSLLLATSASAETEEIKGYLYDLNKEDHIATLMRYNGTSTTVVIPTTIKYDDVEYFVTAIHNRAFRDSKMQKFTFSYCNKLKTITCLAREVPVTEPYAFKYIKHSDITLIVDKSSIDNYKKAEPWCYFENVKSL